jgi:hypothetical protein
MKLVALLAAGALTACASIIPPTGTVVVAQGDTSLDAAYNVAAQAYLAEEGSMPSDQKATVKLLLTKAYPYLVAADKAEALGDATTVTAQAGAAMALISQAKVALGTQ